MVIRLTDDYEFICEDSHDIARVCYINDFIKMYDISLVDDKVYGLDPRSTFYDMKGDMVEYTDDVFKLAVMSFAVLQFLQPLEWKFDDYHFRKYSDNPSSMYWFEEYLDIIMDVALAGVRQDNNGLLDWKLIGEDDLREQLGGMK